jgi:DNA-binding transcriptional regulator YiaG
MNSLDYREPTEAQRVRDLLMRSRLDARQAARELEIDEAMVSRWCMGKAKPSKMAMLALERLYTLHRTIT